MMAGRSSRPAAAVAFAAASLLSLAATAQESTPAIPIGPPAPPSAPSSAVADEAFRASAPGPDVVGHVLTIEAAVELALATVPDITARLQDYAAARYRVLEALSPLLPQLSASAGANKNLNTTIVKSQIRQPAFGPPTPQATISTKQWQSFSDTQQAQVSLSQLLFDFGKTAAATDAARRLADVANQSVELQRQLVVLSAREAYTNLLLAQRLIKVNQESLQRADLGFRVATRLSEGGLRPRSDVARAEIDVANGQVGLIQVRGTEGLALAALNTALGIDVRAATRIVDNLDDTPKVTLDRNALLAEALRDRPEYKQAKFQADANEALYRQAFRNFFPSIVGTGSYGGTQAQLNDNWIVGMSMSWTIFDGGNLVASMKEANANFQASRARIKSTELQIAQDVQQAVVSVEETQARIVAARRAVRAGEANYRFANGRFRAGLATILDLTDAQSSLTQAQATEVQALSDFKVALYQLDRAVGRR